MTTTTTVYLSKNGKKEIEKEINLLEQNLATLTDQLRELDKSDSREERMQRIEKIDQINIVEKALETKKNLLDQAKLFPRKRDALRVAIGSVVDLVDQKGQLIRYTLVDSVEANPSDGRISIRSPLGQSLLGKSVQQTIEWTGSKLTNQLQLVAIK